MGLRGHGGGEHPDPEHPEVSCLLQQQGTLWPLTFHRDGEETPGHIGDVVGEATLPGRTLLGADPREATVPAGGHFHHALLRLCGDPTPKQMLTLPDPRPDPWTHSGGLSLGLGYSALTTWSQAG